MTKLAQAVEDHNTAIDARRALRWAERLFSRVGTLEEENAVFATQVKYLLRESSVMKRQLERLGAPQYRTIRKGK